MKNLTLSLSLSLLKNRIKQNKEKAVILLLSILISVLFVSTITYGATTIGSNIDTGGNLTVSGNATLGDNSTDLIKSIGSFYASSTLQATGATRFYSTLQADGLTTLGNASTTNLSSTGNFWLNGNATTTSQGNIQGQGILTMLGTGTSTYSGGLQGTALNITSSTASSTFANGIILSKGCFLMPDGTCAGAGGGSGTINSGTTGQLSYYAGSGTTLTATSSLFIHSNQNIGIGTTTPNWLLQVAGTRPFLTLSDTGASANNKHWFLSSQGGNFYLGTSSDAYATTSISALTIRNNGNVGIATSSPQSALLSVENTGTGYTFYATDSANDTTPFVIDASGNVGIGTVSPPSGIKMEIRESTVLNGFNTQLSLIDSTFGSGAGGLIAFGAYTTNSSAAATNWAGIQGLKENGTSGNTAGALAFYTLPNNAPNAFVGMEKMRLTSTGNIGIGTTTPYAKLSVVGEAVATYFTATSTTATSTFLGAVGVGTTSPAEQLSVSGRLFVGGTGTSTIQNNLYVMGTLRSTVSYVGDLVFSNNFKFIETPLNAKVQSLFLQNQYGENLFKIDENGKVVMKEITAKQGNFEEKLKTKELQIGSPQNRTGITIYDRKTGDPVCVFSENNILKSSKGECK